jgi:catalase
MTTSTSGKRKQKKGSAPTGDSQPAAGGELHQIAAGEHPALTTNQGLAISDNQNSLRSNPRGPTLLEDFILREKSPISITSVFPNVSYTRVRPVRMGTSS